ncbi:MaoC family dehydratase [Nocardia sp. NPDC049707]|jgi:acyl dehydratase|uniref:MaoC family dehydratase n=1 Tax=Nocardia sp. NPDC049707 TaxID=3154735 RepID=UPI00342AA78D
MTTQLDSPADLIGLAGQQLGTTDWIEITQPQVDLFAEATGDHQWIHTDPQRAAAGPFHGTIAHGYLTLSLAPVVISDVLEIRELTAALNYGLNKVRFPAPVPVGSKIRAVVTLTGAHQKTSGVEAIFGLTYEIDGGTRPACVADVVVLYP